MRTSSASVAMTLIVMTAVGAWYVTHHKPSASPEARRESGTVTSVVTAAALREDFPVLLRAIGNVEPMATVAVKSRVQSALLQQHFTEGQMVKEGDLLFTLDGRELAALVAKDKAALARDQATLSRFRNDLYRAQQLLAKNAGTQQALDQATADVATGEATIQSDQASLDGDQLRLSYTKIYAPISGRAGAVSLTPGNLVNASDSGPGLVTLTQMKPVRVTFALSERELPQIQSAVAGQKTPTALAFPHGGGGAVASGKLNFIDSTINQASGTIMMKAEFANEDFALWPGEYRDVELELGSHANAISIPTVALQAGQNGSYVFVVGADSSAQLREVTPGLVNKDRTEIVAGLAAGEKVVIDGQLRLTIGAPVRDMTDAPRTKVSDTAGGRAP